MRGRTFVLPRFLVIQAFFRSDRQVLKGRNNQAQGVNPVLQGVHRQTLPGAYAPGYDIPSFQDFFINHHYLSSGIRPLYVMRHNGRDERRYVLSPTHHPAQHRAGDIHGGNRHERDTCGHFGRHISPLTGEHRYAMRGEYVLTVRPTMEIRPVVTTYNKHKLVIREITVQVLQRVPCV